MQARSSTATTARFLKRYQSYINRLQTASSRVSWLRLALFLAGVVGVWVAAGAWGGRGGLAVAALAVLLFGGAVAWHRWLDCWQASFVILRDLHLEGLARIQLDWPSIPYHPLAQRSDPESERSALALDLDLTGPRSLHHLLDHTISQQGSQRLAEWLTQGAPDLAHLQARQQLVKELIPLRRFRTRLSLNFRLNARQRLQGDQWTRWLEEPLSVKDQDLGLGWALALVGMNLLLFLGNLYGLPPYWILSLAVYGVYYVLRMAPLNRFLQSVVELDGALDAWRRLLTFLETYPLKNCPRLLALCAPFRAAGQRPSRRLAQVKWITAGVGLRMNPILALLVNLVLPWDFIFAFLAARARRQMAQLIPLWVDAWYELEALLSLANFAALHPDYAFPEVSLTAQPVFSAGSLGHPLIPVAARVCNDFTIENLGQLALITGSNMAGKSTFIKTVGLNLCLAYAGAPVCANRLASLPFRLYTCIRITDSVTDGFSYFYAEVKRLRGLMDALRMEHPQPVLYLIDEIFRGTNNRERLLGSRAYIRGLSGAYGAGFLSTHDLELTQLADELPGVYNYHFRDEVSERRLVFDYKIHPGPSPTTNALKIMQLEGLPV